MSAIHDALAESRRREAYLQGKADGSVVALLGPAHYGEPHRVFGKPLQVTLTWPEGPPPQHLLDGLIQRAEQRTAEAEQRTDWRSVAIADGHSL